LEFLVKNEPSRVLGLQNRPGSLERFWRGRYHSALDGLSLVSAARTGSCDAGHAP
jgi:hypothetical protein